MPGLPTPTGQIQTPGLIWCEGPNDFAFFRRMVGYLGLNDRLRVEQFEGKPNIPTYLEIIRLRPGFSELKALGIVRDADEDAAGALQSVQHHLRLNGLVAPVRAGAPEAGVCFDGLVRSVGIFLAPDGLERGALESLYLRSIELSPTVDCAKAFMQCVTPHLQSSLVAHLAKVEFYTWLAASESPGILPGQAMDANIIDRNNPAFDPIKAFLTQLAAAAEASDQRDT